MPYDLHERTTIFAKNVRALLRKIPVTISSVEDGKQLVRSSGSVGANYSEGNESLGGKDLLYRFKIARKEAKESAFWLQLIDTDQNMELENERLRLYGEVNELIKIFSSIINKIGSRK